MHEIERPAPFRRRREKIGGEKFNAFARKTLARPIDRARDQIEGGHARPGLGQSERIVAEPAADIQGAQPRQRTMFAKPLRQQRMRREIGPGHAGRVALGQRIDRLEPTAAHWVRRDAARGFMRVEGVEPRPRAGAALREIVAHAFFSRFFSAHAPRSSS